MIASPRILIVTYNWPPRNAMGTHRPYAWARYWAEAGAQVTVLTARKQFFDEPLDLHLPALDGVRLIELAYGMRDNSVAGRLLRKPFFLAFLRRFKAFVQKGASKSIDPRTGWYKAALPLINELAAEHDFVVSTFGPNASHLIANAAKRTNPKIFWVADYRDLWDQHVTSAQLQAAQDEMWADHKTNVGNCADMVTAVSEDMVHRLADFCQGDVRLVPNGFDIPESELEQALSAPFRRSSSPINIVHTGTVYRGHRDPTPLLEALAAMVDNREIQPGDVFVDFYGRAVDPIRDLQKNPRFSPFLRLFGHVPRDVAMQAQRDADLLLLLESSDIASRGILTGKVFEYIVAGRPIICVGSRPEFEIGSLLQRTATGRVLDRSDGEDMASIIVERLRGGGAPGWFAPDFKEILYYSRKSQADSLLKYMMSRHG